MPLRSDLTGYTYELGDWDGSSLSGGFAELPSSSCMTKRTRCEGDKSEQKDYRETEISRGIWEYKQPQERPDSRKQIKNQLFVSGRQHSGEVGRRL